MRHAAAHAWPEQVPWSLAPRSGERHPPDRAGIREQVPEVAGPHTREHG